MNLTNKGNAMRDDMAKLVTAQINNAEFAKKYGAHTMNVVMDNFVKDFQDAVIASNYDVDDADFIAKAKKVSSRMDLFCAAFV